MLLLVGRRTIVGRISPKLSSSCGERERGGGRGRGGSGGGYSHSHIHTVYVCTQHLKVSVNDGGTDHSSSSSQTPFSHLLLLLLLLLSLIKYKMTSAIVKGGTISLLGTGLHSLTSLSAPCQSPRPHSPPAQHDPLPPPPPLSLPERDLQIVTLYDHHGTSCCITDKQTDRQTDMTRVSSSNDYHVV